ncbi:MAG: response regulator [Nitrospirae bacterium]|nr:response regulator [Nitrospirota bacterium]
MARVIVADDAAFMRGSLEFIIKNAGHDVAGLAKNGEEAIRMYQELKPDVVMLDILMKQTDGLTALKAIMNADPRARVIMVTALGQETKEDEARKLGATGYIRKPFRQQQIIDEIAKVMQELP